MLLLLSTPLVALAGAGSTELDKLSFYEGHWTCEGTTFASKDGPEEKWKATVDVKRELSRAWYGVKFKVSGKNPSETSEFKGYDPAKKRWVHIFVQSEAGAWGFSTSPGWEKNRMVFTDSEDPKEHSIFTKLSETRYSHRQETDGVPSFEKVCNKRN